ncbi:MAG TPA: hypothetical protein VFP22_02765 [Candidatus Limnocylindrales bacterium]|nr:hypothetical protein [Candidatus Limnocylindrales bacterium]
MIDQWITLPAVLSPESRVIVVSFFVTLPAGLASEPLFGTR